MSPPYRAYLGELTNHPALNTPPPSQVRTTGEQKAVAAHQNHPHGGQYYPMTTPTMTGGRVSSRTGANKENINPKLQMLSPDGGSPVYERKQPSAPAPKPSFQIDTSAAMSAAAAAAAASSVSSSKQSSTPTSSSSSSSVAAASSSSSSSSEVDIPRPEEMPPIIDDGNKPPYSYATLIGMAILRSPNRKLTLSQIYQWINDTFRWYGQSKSGWQNSIRHNLSLNKAFRKQERPKSDPGKGHYWLVEPGCEHQFLNVKTTRKVHHTEFQTKNNNNSANKGGAAAPGGTPVLAPSSSSSSSVQEMPPVPRLLPPTDDAHNTNNSNSSQLAFVSYSATNSFAMATDYTQFPTASGFVIPRDSNSTDDEVFNEDDDDEDKINDPAYRQDDSAHEPAFPSSAHPGIDVPSLEIDDDYGAAAFDTPLKRCNTAIGLQHFQSPSTLGKRSSSSTSLFMTEESDGEDSLKKRPFKRKRTSMSMGDASSIMEPDLKLESPSKGYVSGQGLILGPLTASTTLLPPSSSSQHLPVPSPNTSLRNHRQMIKGLTSVAEFEDLYGSPSSKQTHLGVSMEEDEVSRAIFGSPDKREARRRQYYEQSGVLGFDENGSATDVFGVDVCGVVRRAIEHGGPSDVPGSAKKSKRDSINDLIRFDSPIKTQGNVFSPPKMARKNTAYF